MELFILVLALSAFGAFINAIHRIAQSDESTKDKRRIRFIRDIFAGLGAGIAVLLLNLAMNNNAGILLAAFAAGFAGVAALNQLLRSQGYKEERDRMINGGVDQTVILTQMNDRLLEANSERVKAEMQRDDCREEIVKVLMRQRERKLSDQNESDDEDNEQRSKPRRQ